MLALRLTAVTARLFSDGWGGQRYIDAVTGVPTCVAFKGWCLSSQIPS